MLDVAQDQMRLPIAAKMTVRTGSYVPPSSRRPGLVWGGGTFEFIMRDLNGLPVVSETHEWQPRIDGMIVELYRERHPGAVRLATSFIGNKEPRSANTTENEYLLVQGNRRVPRAMHGRVLVEVTTRHAGTHYVTLRDDSQTDRRRSLSETIEDWRFPWAVQIESECNRDLEFEAYDGACECMPGTQRYGPESPCAVCESGFLRPFLPFCFPNCPAAERPAIVLAATCQSCVVLTKGLSIAGPEISDPNRRATKPTASEPSPADRNNINQCGNLSCFPRTLD